MAPPKCTTERERMSHWGAGLVYKWLELKGEPPACSTAVVDPSNIMVWQKFEGPEDLPRKIVRFQSDGDVLMKDDCEYNTGTPDKVVRKTQPDCTPTDWQKIGSVNPHKLKAFISRMLPPGQDHVQLLINQPPEKVQELAPLLPPLPEK